MNVTLNHDSPQQINYMQLVKVLVKLQTQLRLWSVVVCNSVDYKKKTFRLTSVNEQDDLECRNEE